jgi:hypothetical protein
MKKQNNTNQKTNQKTNKMTEFTPEENKMVEFTPEENAMASRPPMTLGEKRCHINFNPSSDDKIGTFKRMMADAIDYCNQQASEDFEANRCFKIAMEHLETAQMYGVKGIAKGLNK